MKPSNKEKRPGRLVCVDGDDTGGLGAATGGDPGAGEEGGQRGRAGLQGGVLSHRRRSVAAKGGAGDQISPQTR